MKLLLSRYSALFLMLLMLAVSLLVAWFSFDNYRRFSQHQKSLAVQSVQSTASEISHMISFLRRSVNLFAEQESKLLASLSSSPGNDQAYDRLRKKIKRHFPDQFAFTLADAAGTPVLRQSDPLVNARCRLDLKYFARTRTSPQIYTHRFSGQDDFHFDVMTRHPHKGASQILFFVSFKLDVLARLLNHGRVAGHQLLLAEYPHKGKIGIANAGLQKYDILKMFSVTKAGISRFDEELDLDDVLSRAAIAGTNWVVIDRVEPSLFQSELSSLVIKASTIMMIFLGFGLGMMTLFRREVDTTGRTRKTLFGIEEDRRRIAMDMHDQVLSDLTHLARQCTDMRKSIGQPEKIRTHLDKSEMTLEGIADNIRSIINDLHPATLDMLGLEASLRDYMDNRLTGVSQPGITLTAMNFDDRRLTEVQKLNLYRITLEAVHNVVRHAKATHCEIALAMSETRLRLFIEDDGIGFDPQHHSRIHSRGLANISTRGRLIGAHIQWLRAKSFKTGTRFELEMSLAGSGDENRTHNGG